MSQRFVLHLYISGRVQGVGYRYATYSNARKLGLIGWVRNLTDGRVEVLLEGSEEQQEKMITWCYQGSAFANVTHIEIIRESLVNTSDSFSIL
jgi:acylphosphatase